MGQLFFLLNVWYKSLDAIPPYAPQHAGAAG